MGIDSCPIEGFEIDKTSAVLKQHFDIDPERYQPAVMVAFGYLADAPVFPRTRRKTEDIVSFT